MCLRNLFHRRVRTSLCVLGVALGITLIITVGATTNNYVTVLKEMNLFYQGNAVVVSRGALFIQAFPIGGFLQESTSEEIKKVEGVKNIVPMIVLLGSFEQEGVIQLSPPNITIGIPFGNWSILTGSLSLKPGGRWPSALSSEKEIVLGSNLPLRYNLSVNTRIEINGKKLRVVGILDIPSSSSFLRGAFIMSLNTAQEVYGYPNIISMIVVVPDEGVTEKELVDRIEAEIVGVRGLTGEERNEVMAPIFHDIELWSFGIGGAVSSINLILVLVVSFMNVSERSKELATLDAIGIPQISIIRMVVTETGLMGLFGALIGAPLGMIGAFLIIFLYTQSPMSIIMSNAFVIVPPRMILLIMTTTFALSCIAGFISALTLSRKNIVKLMRSDS